MKLSEQNVEVPRRDREAALVLPTAALALAGCLWGTGFLFGKIALQEMTVSESVVFRFVCGSVLLAPVLFRKRARFQGNDIWLLMLASVIGVPLQFLVQFTGLEATTVSHASLIVGTIPMMLALGSAMFLSERLKPLEWGMLVLSGLGALLIALSKANSATGPQPTTRGDLLVLVSLVASVVMMLITKRVVERHDSMHFTACMIILGTIFLILWAEFFKPVRFHFSARAWIAVALQGLLATAGAYLLWNWGVSRVPVSRAGVFLNLEPVVGATLGVWLLGETLGTAAIAGGLMIIGSAIYFSRRMPA